jgi:hypothetical protein
VHPGRLQSLCRSLSFEGSAQNEEVSGGQVPRGYPKQEVPVGSGDVSGMCLTTDIRIPSLPTQDRPVCSRMITIPHGNWSEGLREEKHRARNQYKHDEEKQTRRG